MKNECPSSVDKFLTFLEVDSIRNIFGQSNLDDLGKIDSSQNLTHLLSFVYDLHSGHSLDFIDLPKFKYYMVISTAHFLGKLNDESVKEWLFQIAEINKRKPNFIYPVIVTYDVLPGLQTLTTQQKFEYKIWKSNHPKWAE